MVVMEDGHLSGNIYIFFYPGWLSLQMAQGVQVLILDIGVYWKKNVNSLCFQTNS